MRGASSRGEAPARQPREPSLLGPGGVRNLPLAAAAPSTDPHAQAPTVRRSASRCLPEFRWGQSTCRACPCRKSPALLEVELSARACLWRRLTSVSLSGTGSRRCARPCRRTASPMRLRLRAFLLRHFCARAPCSSTCARHAPTNPSPPPLAEEGEKKASSAFRPS